MEYSYLGYYAPFPVNRGAYLKSSAQGLTTQYVDECTVGGPLVVVDCGPAKLGCVNGTCTTESRACCMCPRDAGL
jgi:hypothetical protein